MYKNIVSGKCECPANMPILARGTCVFCPVPNSYVDEKLGICQSCPQGTHAIPEMNQCVCPDTMQLINNTCSCPAELPNLSWNHTCLSCVLP